ncbi:MAG: cytochrome c [Acidobacteriia bacterium]|nr:cytochrome c [Terriglobia bacterium]
MKIKILIMSGILALGSLVYGAGPPRSKDSSSLPVVQSREDAENARIQGEQRFHANCGRCHAAPQKFPPRMMATIVRHMRVRATITDEDMRLILGYMTQ